jgi:hypothetical protein
MWHKFTLTQEEDVLNYGLATAHNALSSTLQVSYCLDVTGRVLVSIVLCATVRLGRQWKEQLFRTGVFGQLSTAGSDLTGRYNDRT